MRSLDINILARAVLNDHAQQTGVAKQILDEPAFVLATVTQELVWLLKSKGWSRADIVAAFDNLMSLPQLRFQSIENLRWALAHYAKGGDFADFLHLSLSLGCDHFTTFDKEIARRVADPPVPVETLG